MPGLIDIYDVPHSLIIILFPHEILGLAYLILRYKNINNN